MCLILFSTGSSGFKNIELISNGDFESSPEQQREQASAWMMSSSNPATISELFAHSGRYSLRTNNGSAYQIIKTDSSSNLTLSFWVYLHSVPGCPIGRTISAIDILITTTSSVKGLSYYVTGDHRYPRENIKDIRISNLECDRWNYVVCNLEEDFIKEYPNITFDTVQQINVTLWAIMSPEPIPYWDDISLTGTSKTLKQKLSETTPSSDTPISTETMQRVAALPEDTNSIYQTIIEQRRLIILGLSFIVIFIAMVLVRKRHNTTGINEGDQVT
ncbi:hypothetical protein [[Eubacterium] cellulosolvens]